jgi:hypothetical protein
MKFIFPCGNFAYWNMTFAFHDLKHIIEDYIDDLLTNEIDRSSIERTSLVHCFLSNPSHLV